MTKRLVELMGGAIGVESTVGRAACSGSSSTSAATPSLADGGSEPAALRVEADRQTGAPLRTLLYVEDNPANLKLVEQLIARRPDMRLLSASDGTLGIEIARACAAGRDPDGHQSARHQRHRGDADPARSDPATAHIPVIALSANAMPRDIEKGLEAGFFRYLTKPIKVDEFMEALDVALEHAGAQPAGAA